ncbi:4-hydroxy-tetrahydrodipicolinate synthase [Lentisphaera profundi]|uniref:4-hydroxy-tetrahydrodipicolinate synthase n=1 Tax=Lentisphaera profundi TaxID=1658616 RepID=A0ABY7VY41_9BACT|nr:4-hydroxy-tetrahydrodipicolinate synthase [Lentisphaera profundi]WDE99090.1 4-hydroxy-tetrahydrodipicolinate synthase [Lentisphaera profundi]
MTIKGCYTALITPFDSEGNVDYEAFERIINDQISAGIDGIVAVGTTGESPTLGYADHSDVIRFAVKTAAGRCKVVAGTGANCTKEAIELTKQAHKDGADASLQVTPYYNKPTQEGLYLHIKAIADSADMPIILYNVPGRSAISLDIDTIVRMNTIPQVVAVKEAGGCVDRISQIKQACDIQIVSGDDSLTLPMMSVGASGVISVLSNILPAEMTELCRLANAGQFSQALEIHQKYYKLMNDMFIESNPIPVKTMMATLGYGTETFRLPLCPITEGAREVLYASAQNAGIKI